MNLHEYQAKRLLREHGVPVPAGDMVRSTVEAVRIAHHIGRGPWVVKAQVHAGGRGKAGGVRVVGDLAELDTEVGRLLGSRLVTGQTGPGGLPVEAVLLEAPVEAARELYLGMLVDRRAERVTVIASAAGGMEIEEVAARDPGALVQVWANPAAGLQAYQARQLGFAIGLDARQAGQLAQMLLAMYELLLARDLSLIEINPLVVTAAGDLLALDAKINVDDNALYRHKRLAEWRDPDQEEPKERLAREHGLNYVTLEGEIACMVNGAGLAMATMDLIQLHGGRPANFLDVGGGATAEKVAEAFKLIQSDPQVRAILVNIFGGIVRCDLIAQGILDAAREVDLRLPLVVRLEGTHAEQGRARLAASGLDVIPAEALTEAAEKVVAAAGVDR